MRGTWRGAAEWRSHIDLDAVPLAAGVREVAERLGADPAVFAATGGEDYRALRVPAGRRGVTAWKGSRASGR